MSGPSGSIESFVKFFLLVLIGCDIVPQQRGYVRKELTLEVSSVDRSAPQAAIVPRLYIANHTVTRLLGASELV